MTGLTRPTAAAEAAAAEADPVRRLAGPALLAWILVLCFVPDPRPLGAPEWAVSAVRSVAGVGESAARAVATVGLRAGGLALLGALTMLTVGSRRWDRRCVVALLLAPVLGLLTLWVNYGYYPIAVQIRIAVIAAVLGALLGLALRRNGLAVAAFAGLAGGLFGFGAATGIRDDLDAMTRVVGRHVLASAAEVPDGDAGFARLLEIAFAFAADNAQDTDPVPENRAAVLALAVILGDEKVAGVAGRSIDEARMPDVEALRQRVTLQGRKDWPRHFWVSAGLTVLADADRSIAVGLAKELMDAQEGGTGFSFADLAADAAGNRFALAATRDAAAARAQQERVRGGADIADFCPELRDLPEGITAQAFHEQYGGLGGDGTNRWVDEIRRRLAACNGLR